ncbi:hypothetical protein [Altericista sp. CCNU0014]|uniref:hypothetical protein n=1 Tax=Altericista sp. CCNU0014 TaxID=3082949 RepID=UPI00384FBA29
MTKADRTRPNPNMDEDDILPEYDLSKISYVRGKHAHLVGQPHTVTIHQGDGTATVQKFDSTGNMTSEKHNVWIGDRIAGDKVAGDKVMGNKVQIGTVQGDAVAGNKIVNAQNLTEAAKEIQDLIEQLAQTYPTDTMPAKVSFANAIVQRIDANTSLSQRILSAGKAGSIAAIGQVLNHPLASFVIAAIEDWQKSKNASNIA